MKLLCVAVALVFASPAGAQEAAPRNVRPVHVLSTAGDEIQGQLVMLGSNSATLLVNGLRRELPLESILRIETRGDSVRKMGR